MIPGWAGGLALAIAALAAVPGGSPAGAPLQAAVRLDPEEITIGDPLSATLTVRFAPGWVVETPAIGPVHGAFRVGPIAPPDRRSAAGGGGEVVYRIPLGVYRPGPQIFPPVAVRGLRPGASEGFTAATAPVQVMVRSVLSGADREIADIKGPAALPSGWSLLWWLAAAAAAAAVWIWSRRRGRRRASALPPEPELPAHEWAHRRLQALADCDLLARGEIMRWIIEFAAILKGFLHRRFRIVTLERTTEEVLEALRFARTGPAVAATVRDLLTRCDLVKFARQRPMESEARGLLDAARGLVDRTREPGPLTLPGPGGAAAEDPSR